MSYDFYNTMRDIESKGDYSANREGSAFYGAYQFSEKSATPYLAKIGKTWDQYKNDPAVQDTVVRMETDANKKIMKGWGKKEVTDMDLWKAHNIGVGNARKDYLGNTSDPGLVKAVQNQAGNPVDVAAYNAYYAPKFNGENQTPLTPVTAPAPITLAAATTPEQGLITPKPVSIKAPDASMISSMFMPNSYQGLGSVTTKRAAPTEVEPIGALAGLGGFRGFMN